ncbi:MAG TPA: FkbM family methyltransferase [Gammaproteobacteria bacterium]|nr:FkbM family methyltransferase [Gammaproteobacteria bacterium]
MNTLRRWIRRTGARLDARRGLKSRDPFVVTRQLVTRPAPVILDVGAHIGDTVARYRSLFSDAYIHAFEPFPGSFDRLAMTIGRDPRTYLHRLALTDREGAVSLNVNRSDATNSILASDGRAAFFWGEQKLTTETRIDVSASTLDGFASRQRVDHIDVLKIDVQGAEFSVLQGANETLRQHRIDVLYMELIVAPTYVGQHKLHEYLALLDSLGYVLFAFYNQARRNGRLIQADGLFVSEPFLRRREEQGPSPT